MYFPSLNRINLSKQFSTLNIISIRNELFTNVYKLESILQDRMLILQYLCIFTNITYFLWVLVIIEHSRFYTKLSEVQPRLRRLRRSNHATTTGDETFAPLSFGFSPLLEAIMLHVGR